ncbi:DUF5683 domain-containing protein [Gracilimonas mengyeensis]|uniref:DUF5683 domain-containing protein n=1 Tax=Gracilimonas mengyeensis TaxID=1302730 RepID=A0A521FFB5_9BACT|nr:DUF5683 domain-containing protein [Gracilimonas mengyeensis]SMO94872.1 hypothetical protein SAMN06265219_11842 [Gracilimonas mengyeensis]
MIRFTLILLSTLWACSSIQAQNLSAFQNEIFKQEESSSPEKPKELDISDFRYQGSYASSSSVLSLPREKAGAAFLASALVPGSGQAFNKKWVRAGLYFTAEVLGIVYYLDRNATARRQEKNYEEFTHQNWSVMAYAQWLVRYSDANNLSQPQLDQLRNMVFENGRPLNPTWGNTPADWQKVNISVLHTVENNTPFILDTPAGCWDNDPPDCNRRSNFSHTLPQYGSQQYYELISKYYQYQSGWRDWYGNVTTAENQDAPALYQYMWNGRDEPNGLFYTGRDRAEEFNDNYRIAGNILKLLVVNHVVSAFDAFITVKLKNSRIETQANLLQMEQVSLTWHF